MICRMFPSVFHGCSRYDGDGDVDDGIVIFIYICKKYGNAE